MTRRNVVSGLLTVITALVVAAFVAVTWAADGDTGSTGQTTFQPTISVRGDGGRLGPYLTDGQGRPLYARQAGQDRGECAGRCAEIWPPFILTEAPAPAEDALVRDDLIGRLQRGDGTLQATYGGNALYYYVLDESEAGSGAYGAGEALGQGVHDEWGSWFLLDPDGQKVEGLLDPR